MQLSNIKAIISGGASGLGNAVAEYIVASGGSVTLLDVNDEKGRDSAKALGERAHYIDADVRNEAEVEQAVAYASQQMDGLNMAVNCAGVIGAKRALGREGPMALDFFSNVIQINLVGSFNLTKAAAHVMSQNEPGEDGERGVIVNTASVAAYEGQIGQSAYSASKGGIVGMTLPLAREFTRIGVRVVTVAPGVFHTPMVDGMPEDVYKSLCEQVPFPSRLGSGEEFAKTVAFIAENRYVNGTTIRVDGAIRMQPK